MRKVPLVSAVAAVVLGLAGVVSFSVASQAAAPSVTKPSLAQSKTLTFDVVFSPLNIVAANNVRNPHSPFSLGDELVFHDQLFSSGQHVGDEAGSCVIVDVSQAALSNCTEVIRLPHGTIVSTDDHLGKSVYPDIVVHQRELPANLLAIEVLGKELDVTMALCGVKSVREIDRRLVAPL